MQEDHITIPNTPLGRDGLDNVNWREMYELVTNTLSVIIEEIASIKTVQAEVADNMSLHVKALADLTDDSSARKHMSGIVANAQAEDYLRQRHEQIVGVLTVLRKTLDKAGHIEGDTSGGKAAHALLIDEAKTDMFDPIVMHEMRQALANALQITPQRVDTDQGANYDSGNDAELF